jgi:hypothetical protein
MDKNRTEKPDIEGTGIERSNTDRIKNDRTEIERKGDVLMEEKKENINLGQEFGDCITESMIVKQELSNIAFLLDNFNPVTRTLVYRQSMPDEESKKIVADFCKSEMPNFLQQSKRILDACYNDGIKMTDILSDILEKRKAKIPGNK